MVKNLLSSGGDVGLIPRWGDKIPHAEGQLSPSATISEAHTPGAHAPQLERSPSNEEQPKISQSRRASTKTQCRQKNK